MTGQLWSWLLTAIGVTGLWLAGSQRVTGWIVCLTGQSLWATYAVVTRQWGFLAAAAVYGFLYGRNWRRWHRKTRPTPQPADDSLPGWACGAYQPQRPDGLASFRCTAPYGHDGDHRAWQDAHLLARWPRSRR